SPRIHPLSLHDALPIWGIAVDFGRSLLRLLRAEGLSDVAGDAYLPLSPAVRTLERANVLQLRDEFVERGTVTTEEIDRYLAWLRSEEHTSELQSHLNLV